ncbi:GL18232 [Drosophila persimilis]|uniref:GL18232 n=1 Tax=Drosophila persimilis TaxID=7234 RepID=B4H4H3_DROPE|nr:GL18232 [Drosophila persimilis]
MSMATAQGTSCAMAVVGVPLRTGNKYPPRLTMRRVFNTKCFRTERYRHEIANHYRDYQIQQHLNLHQKHPLAHRHRHQRRRRRLGLAAEASRMSSSLAPTYAQLRDVWPTPVQYFPRFDDTYAARGRLTICSGEPPDETYNDARALWISSSGQRRRRKTSNRNDDNVSGEDDEDSHGNGNGNSKGTGRSRSSDREGSHVNYNLNISNNQVENLQRQPHRERVDYYTYLQLASGYYERGLHANIKYLESIGQRNAIRRTSQLQTPSSLGLSRPFGGATSGGSEVDADWSRY